MSNIHDPYLNTVIRDLNEKKIKLRKKELSSIPKKSKSFLSKNIVLSDYIYLPESLEKFFLLSIFILIPYLFGLFIILVMMGEETFEKYTTFNFHSFMLSWTIGYESISLILLILIIQSAISFKKS